MEARFVEIEVELKREEQKTHGTRRLLELIKDYAGNTGEAWLYDEAVLKIGSITPLKLIHICVDYSAKMKKILAEMRILFVGRNQLPCTCPTLLEKTSDLSEVFSDLPPMEVLQGLSTLTMLKTNSDSFGSRLPKDPGSDVKSRLEGVKEVQSIEGIPTSTTDMTLLLLTRPAPIISVNPPPDLPFSSDLVRLDL